MGLCLISKIYLFSSIIILYSILITHDFKVAKKYAKDVWLKKFKEIEKLYNNEDPKVSIK